MRQKKNTGGSESISAYRLTDNLWKGFVLRRELICGRAAETERKEHEVRPLPVSSSWGNGVCEKHIVWSFELRIRGDTVSHTASALAEWPPRRTAVWIQTCSENTQSIMSLYLCQRVIPAKQPDHKQHKKAAGRERTVKIIFAGVNMTYTLFYIDMLKLIAFLLARNCKIQQHLNHSFYKRQNTNSLTTFT